MNNIKENPILILDFGSQYTQLIARRIREMNVYCEIFPYNLDADRAKNLSPRGIILSGGPASAIGPDTPKAPDWVFQAGVPILGICYGMQTMAVQLGGSVSVASKHEYGAAKLFLKGHSPLLTQIEDRSLSSGAAVLDVWMSHGDHVTKVPPGFEVIAETANAPIAAMMHESKHWYGLQFHPEVTHTRQGERILQRFIFDICQARKNWTVLHILKQLEVHIRQTIGEEKVVLGLSGGVDSSVVAALLHQVIGKQLECVFVDTGLLRLHEADEVMHMLTQHMGIKVNTISAEKEFLSALQGVTCPEEKRKIIGRTFIEVFQAEAKRLGDIRWLAQGTIYSDVIESAQTETGFGEVIKSHHNVGGLPELMHLKLLEPLRELFKDEVRVLGLELGLSHELLYRHPFPGPGLGVRIIGEVRKEYADILRQADAIFIHELKTSNLYHEVSQAFAVFLPIKSVGVTGDGRRYEHVICLRAVVTSDFMTATWAKFPWEFLERVSTRIINEVAKVSRVTYDISSKPPATIEWE